MGRREGKGGVWAPDFGMVGPSAMPRQVIRIQKRLSVQYHIGDADGHLVAGVVSSIKFVNGF